MPKHALFFPAIMLVLTLITCQQTQEIETEFVDGAGKAAPTSRELGETLLTIATQENSDFNKNELCRLE